MRHLSSEENIYMYRISSKRNLLENVGYPNIDIVSKYRVRTQRYLQPVLWKRKSLFSLLPPFFLSSWRNISDLVAVCTHITHHGVTGYVTTSTKSLYQLCLHRIQTLVCTKAKYQFYSPARSIIRRIHIISVSS